jgi:hypothetical protein
MKIKKQNIDLNLLINKETNFKTDLGWEEGMIVQEKEILKTIINPTENYETVRFIHQPYESLLDTSIIQTDIWYNFYFIDGDNGYTKGLDYELVGITKNENALMLKQSTESFFRLEFFKTPNNEPPNRTNRRLVFAKNLSLPLGEKVFNTDIHDYLYAPVFVGSNYRNKENMYLFWFQDESVFDETTLTGNTFYVSARFYNAKDASKINFTNTGLDDVTTVLEERDLYYKLIIDKDGDKLSSPIKPSYNYVIYEYNGETDITGNRVGTTNSPIKFYEMRGITN